MENEYTILQQIKVIAESPEDAVSKIRNGVIVSVNVILDETNFPQTKFTQEIPQSGLGDLVAAIATPVARVLKLPCIDPKTGELLPESGCAKRKEALNRLTRGTSQ